MEFLNKFFLPYNAIVIALFSVILITAEKRIAISNGELSLVISACDIIIFFIGLSRVIFGEYKQKLLINNIFICMSVNILLLFFLLELRSPEISQANVYLRAYDYVHRSNWLAPVIFSVFIPGYLLYYNSWVSKKILLLKKHLEHDCVVTVSRYIFCVMICNFLLMLHVYSNGTLVFIINSFRVSLFVFLISSITLALLSFFIMRKACDEKKQEIPGLFVIMGSLCVTLLINSHSICYKFVELPLFGVVSASGIMFPLTFLIADVVAEHYGYSASRILIWSTLLAQFVFVIFVYLIYLLPNPAQWIESVYFEQLFSNLIPRQLMAASISVFFSFFIFTFLISIFKANMQSKKFWKRTLIANILANAVLCCVSYLILYYGKYNPSYILYIILDTWILKMIIATFGTFIFTIPCIYYLKLNDQRAYSYKSQYNPFVFKLHFGSSHRR